MTKDIEKLFSLTFVRKEDKRNSKKVLQMAD